MIGFTLSIEEDVELSRYNLGGQRVATLARGWLPASTHTVRWDGRDDLGRELTSGVYLYSMEPESRWTGAKITAAAMILDSAGRVCWAGWRSTLRIGSIWTCEVAGP